MAAPLVVVSPHLDDAALSASALLVQNPGSVLLTVFGGGPRPASPLTAWDAECQFNDGDDVIAARLAEDEEACRLLKAHQMALPYWDIQYRQRLYGYRGPKRARKLARTIRDAVDALCSDRQAAICGTTRWAVPLGIAHVDHLIVAAAMRMWRRTQPQIEMIVYEDMPYAAENAGHRRDALSRWNDGPWILEPMCVGTTLSSEKKRALESYRSQNCAMQSRIVAVLNAGEVFHSVASRGTSASTL